MTAATRSAYVAEMPLDDARLGSNSDTGEEESNEPPPSTPDDSVYCNKQLTSHLIKQVCSRPRPNGLSNATGSGRSSSSNSNNSSNRSSGISTNNNNVLISTSTANDPTGYDRSNSASTRSHSPEEAHNHPAQPMNHQQRDSVDGGQASSGYLSASTASGLSGASPAYVSPFALSPLNEEVRSPWSKPAISMNVIKNPRTAELERVLFRLCDEFEDRLHGRFESFSSRLDTEPATIRESVTRELETLFYDDNVHWGRIIAVFVLTKELCDKCLSEGRPELSAAVQQWVAEFIDQHLWQWVRKNQGWYGLIKFYQETGGDRAGNGAAGLFSSSTVWQSMALLLTLSAASIAIALTASYFRR